MVQDVADLDAVLGVGGEFRPDFGQRRFVRYLAALGEEVEQGGGEALGGGENRE